ISLGAVALGDITFMLLGTHIPFWLAVFIFCATFCLYNIQRVYASWKLSDVERQTTERHDWVTNMRIPMTLLTVTALIAGAISVLKSFVIVVTEESGETTYSLNFSENAIDFYLSCIIAGVIALSYALPVIPARPRWKRLRDLPGLKVILVAVVWAIVTVVWPYTSISWRDICITGNTGNEYYLCAKQAAVFLLIIVTLYIYAITIPFDIRDYLIDGAKVKSLPVVLGIRRARIVAMLVLVPVAGICIAGMILLQHLQAEFLMIALVCVPTAIVIGLATPKRHEYYYSLLTDGLLLLLWFAVWLAFSFMH
ncbi:MAG: hypothetical protein ACRC3B_10875, partial [Bacteroidia bacterium]